MELTVRWHPDTIGTAEIVSFAAVPRVKFEQNRGSNDETDCVGIAGKEDLGAPEEAGVFSSSCP